MTEISFITQNGEQINLKDAKGRELLAEKQKKLKAGKGISISEDGVISAISGGSGVTRGEIVIKDLPLSNWCGENYTYDLTLEYIGNPGVLKSSKNIFPMEPSGPLKYYPQGLYEKLGKTAAINYSLENESYGEAIYDEIVNKVASGELANTGEHFFYVKYKEAVITDSSYEGGNDSHFYNKNQKILQGSKEYTETSCGTEVSNEPLLITEKTEYNSIYYHKVVNGNDNMIGIPARDIEEIFWTK